MPEDWEHAIDTQTEEIMIRNLSIQKFYQFGKRIRMFEPFISPLAFKEVSRVLRSGFIGEGPKVLEFERLFKRKFKIAYPVALNSGTSALHLALDLAGVGTGDEVITTAQTMVATSQAILMQKATPVFADIQYKTGNINPEDIEHRVTNKTKALLVVHWGGYPCDLDAINILAKKHNLMVIEDAAQALGAIYKNKNIGSISPFTCFSFQAIKHVTTGDGGMLVLKNKAHYDKARVKRWFGIDRLKRKPSLLGEFEWNITEIGYKYHMNDIAAALGIVHLNTFQSRLKKLNKIAKLYRRELSSIPGITLFDENPNRKGAQWLFSMHVERRDSFVDMMNKKGVEVSVVHSRIDKNGIFGTKRNDLTNLERFEKTQICIPMHSRLKDKEAHYIINCIKKGW